MPLIAFPTSQLLWMRVAALLFTCVAFSVSAHGAALPSDGMADWCIFCWVASFIFTLLVLRWRLFHLQARAPVSWNNFHITVACYAALLCLSASVIFPLFFLRYQRPYQEAHDHRVASTIFSCLAALAYIGEVSLSRARPGEVAGYMATAPGLLKVFQTFVACLIFIQVSHPDSYDRPPWAEVVLGLHGYLPVPFSKFLSVYGLLAAIMYLTATIIWPVFQFGKFRRNDRNELIATAVLTALNFLLYMADLAYTARLVNNPAPLSS
uniref:Myeloid associated differentiation marker n=1 Tax=Gouania willdenowi TaxID=441366 RepID=A0A8C5N682_GOUWI